MVVGYLDIFVFEELGFAVGPVMDGIDGVIHARGENSTGGRFPPVQ